MFYYFGRKGRAAKSYPAPEYPLVIEPFAGSMAYTLAWQPPFAIGTELDEEIHALWHRISSMTADEIRDYPAAVVGQRSYDRWVILAAQGNKSNIVQYRTVNWYMAEHFEQQRKMALRNLDYVNESVIYKHGDYRDLPDVEATWFIDPPYQGVNVGYRHGSDQIDYEELARWCLTRKGQVIICEGAASTWLPFQHHKELQGVPDGTKNTKRLIEKVVLNRTHSRCECGTTFPATRSDARFCSARCRQRAARARSRETQPETVRVKRRRIV